MKMLSCFIAIGLFYALTGAAGASPLDFKMGVLDPPAQLTYTSIDNPASPFSVSFSTCPTDISADGCFTGYNDTSGAFTVLDLTFADNSVLNGQAPTCDTTVAGSLFAGSSCSLNGPTYILDFFGGTGIAPGAFFFIEESGVNPPAGFGTGTGIVTPEPSSVLLTSTGLALLLGFMFVTKQGRELRGSLLSSC